MSNSTFSNIIEVLLGWLVANEGSKDFELNDYEELSAMKELAEDLEIDSLL